MLNFSFSLALLSSSCEERQRTSTNSSSSGACKSALELRPKKEQRIELNFGKSFSKSLLRSVYLVLLLCIVAFFSGCASLLSPDLHLVRRCCSPIIPWLISFSVACGWMRQVTRQISSRSGIDSSVGLSGIVLCESVHWGDKYKAGRRNIHKLQNELPLDLDLGYDNWELEQRSPYDSVKMKALCLDSGFVPEKYSLVESVQGLLSSSMDLDSRIDLKALEWCQATVPLM